MRTYEVQLRVFNKNGGIVGERFLGQDGKTWEIGDSVAIAEAVKKIAIPPNPPLQATEPLQC